LEKKRKKKEKKKKSPPPPQKKREKKKEKRGRVSTKKVNIDECTFSHWMRNPTPSSGQNCQLVRWWVLLVHAGPCYWPSPSNPRGS
jgi:hypothetical protein